EPHPDVLHGARRLARGQRLVQGHPQLAVEPLPNAFAPMACFVRPTYPAHAVRYGLVLYPLRRHRYSETGTARDDLRNASLTYCAAADLQSQHSVVVAVSGILVLAVRVA